MPSLRLLPLALLPVLLAGCREAEPSTTIVVPHWSDPGPVRTYPHAVAIAPDNKSVLVGYRYSGEFMPENLVLYEIPSGKRRPFIGHERGVTFVDFLPDGERAVSASADQTVRVWNVATGKEETRLNYGSMIALSSDGKKLLNLSSFDEATLWDFTSHRSIATINTEGYTQSLSLSRTGAFGLFGSGAERKHNIRLWDSRTRKLSRLTANGSGRWCGSFSANESYVVCERRRPQRPGTYLVIFDVKTGEEFQWFSGHEEDVVAAFFLPDGNHVLSAGREGKVALWHVPSANQIWSRNLPVAVFALSRDGTTAITASSQPDLPRSLRRGLRIDIWDVMTGTATRLPIYYP